MIQEFFPSEWNCDMIHQFRSNQLSSQVTLDGVNIQEIVVRVCAILKLVDVTQPLRIREGSSTFAFELTSQL